VIYIWRTARRPRSQAPVGEPVLDRRTPTAGNTHPPPSLAARIVVVVFFVAMIAAIEYSDRVALVQAAVTDYMVVAAIGGLIGVVILRRRVALPAGARSALGTLTFIGMVAGAGAGGAVLLLANALLDPGPAREFSTVVATRHCVPRPGVIAVRGAPVLPVAADTMRVNVGYSVCRAARAGDTVVVVIGPGFFGRPWIQGVRLHAANR